MICGGILTVDVQNAAHILEELGCKALAIIRKEILRRSIVEYSLMNEVANYLRRWYTFHWYGLNQFSKAVHYHQ